MLTIAAFARLSGVSSKALRSYDELGLFAPAWVDPATAYRYYSPAQLPAIRRIVALRQLGMGLDEIGTAVREGRLRDALERRREQLEQARADAERRLALLGIRVALAESDDSGPDVVVRELPEERVATLDLRLTGGDAEAAFDELEAFVRDRGRRSNRPPSSIDDGASVVVAVPVDRPLEPTERIDCRTLPPELAVTLIHRGPYGSIGQAWRSLERWAVAASFVPVGSRRVLYLQFGADPALRLSKTYLVDRAEDFVTELQLPVNPRSAGARTSTARRLGPAR